MSTMTSSFSFEHLTAEERIALIGELWDSLDPAASMPLTPELAEELDRRDAEVDADPDEGVPWETVIKELRDEFR